MNRQPSQNANPPTKHQLNQNTSLLINPRLNRVHNLPVKPQPSWNGQSALSTPLSQSGVETNTAMMKPELSQHTHPATRRRLKQDSILPVNSQLNPPAKPPQRCGSTRTRMVCWPVIRTTVLSGQWLNSTSWTDCPHIYRILSALCSVTQHVSINCPPDTPTAGSMRFARWTRPMSAGYETRWTPYLFLKRKNMLFYSLWYYIQTSPSCKTFVLFLYSSCLVCLNHNKLLVIWIFFYSLCTVCLNHNKLCEHVQWTCLLLWMKSQKKNNLVLIKKNNAI